MGEWHNLAGQSMKYDSEGNVIGFEGFPTFETERLFLRRMTLDDIDFYIKHFSAPDIVRSTLYDAPADLGTAIDELKKYCIDGFLNDSSIRWGIALKESPDLIGTCGFYKWDKIAKQAEIGYDLAASFRRRGIMAEALTAMIDYAFGPVRLDRLEALVEQSNEGSTRLLRKLGFKIERVLPKNECFHGETIDDYLCVLLREDWGAE
jgi:ribosomal-protein-alanine N-acetyltransferase